jgi:excisionase family DNA binding protein
MRVAFEMPPGSRMAVSIPELARLTGISEGLLYLKANEGHLPGYRRLGKRFLVHLETFEEYLKLGTGDIAAGGNSPGQQGAK